MNISVIGVGYVGLVTGVCLADTSNRVLCMDVDQTKIAQLQKQEVFLYEPQLEKVLQRTVKQNYLRFTTNLAEAVAHADLIFLALPTPNGGDGHTDLKYVLQVAEEVGKCMRSYKIIVNKSTVPVGTTALVKQTIQRHYDGDFDVASNPEFLREGSAVMDFMKPDRIVIGTQVDKVREVLTALYEPYVQQGNPIIVMDERSAELTKYVANSFLATKISFMNEMALFAEKVGANIDLIRRGVGVDARIGKSFLYAGIGYGGSCFPKDVKSLIYQQKQAGCEAAITQAVDATNQQQILFFTQKILDYFGKIEGRKFAIWGLSFKPNTDDIREAPSLKCIDFLLEHRAKVSVFDPEAMAHVRTLYGETIDFAQSHEEAVCGADALLIVTEWREFSTPNFVAMRQSMSTPIIFDGRNLFALKAMHQQAFDYISIGRPALYHFSKPRC